MMLDHANDSTPILDVKDAAVHFPLSGRNRFLRAVDGVSFDVRPRETFGIIGESGSGKSTLGRSLVCLQALTTGTLLHEGVAPGRLNARKLREHRRSYQMVFQDPNASLNPRIPVGLSIREPLDIAGEMSMSDRESRVFALMERVGLHRDLAFRYPHEISGGQKQRVNIARALTHMPKLIVCDEVVAALDVSIQADVLNLFAELQRDFGLTYVFISHDLGVVTHISDRVAVMYLGHFMEMGPTDGVTLQPLHPYTQALLAAEPAPLPPSMRGPKAPPLKGEIPSPVTPPSGCRFRTRCPIAKERCAAEVPTWREAEPGHWVACHFAQRGAV
jgi:peptide/nickel transport system ATP-binding protein/oligopeptide transport system ATP-binding protein